MFKVKYKRLTHSPNYRKTYWLPGEVTYDEECYEEAEERFYKKHPYGYEIIDIIEVDE